MSSIYYRTLRFFPLPTHTVTRAPFRRKDDPPGRGHSESLQRASGQRQRWFLGNSAWTRVVGSVPTYGLPYGFLERRGLDAEGFREVGVVHDERLLELVEHLDRLAQGRVEEA